MDISRRSFIIGGTTTLAALSVASAFSGCTKEEAKITKSGLNFKNFETNGVKELKTGLEDTNTSNVPTKLYTITNKNGAELCITNFGARIVSLLVPDKDGKMRDVIVGFDTIEKYADFNNYPGNYYGAVVGRYANRINKGQFSIDGKTYQLDQNEKGNLLHGGKFGTHYQTFTELVYDENRFLKLELISPDGEMGFPGELKIQVTYSLNDNNTVGIYYEVATTKDTPINISNHAFFDIDGDTSASIKNNKLFFASKQITPVSSSELIPTGEIANIKEDSPNDFFGANAKYYKQGKEIGKDIDANDQQLKYGSGYDFNYVLLSQAEQKQNGIDFDGKFEITNDGSGELENDAKIAAILQSPVSGIKMTITTNEPGLQFYSGQKLSGMPKDKHDKEIPNYACIALEPQHFPDSPNHTNFPNTILKPNTTYKSKSEYKFTV